MRCEFKRTTSTCDGTSTWRCHHKATTVVVSSHYGVIIKAAVCAFHHTRILKHAHEYAPMCKDVDQLVKEIGNK